MKNRRKGSTFLEAAVAIGIVVVVVGLMGPIVRYYLKLGQRFSYGISVKAELDGSYQKLDQVIQSISFFDKWGGQQTGTKNAGIGIRDNYSPTVTEKLSAFLGNIMSTSGQTVKFTTGNTLYVMVPVYQSNDPAQGGKPSFLASFYAFRFLNVNGETGLYYSNSLNSSGGVDILANQDFVPFGDESLLLPTGIIIKKLVPNGENASNHNYFTEVQGGVIMHLEYYIDPTKTVDTGLNASSNIAVVEKLFLKRGEI